MIEIIQRELTDTEIAEREEYEAGAFDREINAVAEKRQAAYQRESDPLNFKWQETGLDVDRVAWLEKKDEIKARYPDPVPPKAVK